MVEIGERMPEKLKLVDTDLKQVKLDKEIIGKPAVLVFFPGAFTGVCTTEMCKFRDEMTEFNSLNGTVYGISVDGPFANKEFKAKNNLNFVVLSDLKKKAVKAFGIELKNFAKVRGYNTAKRSVFIVDSEGAVRYKWISDDPTVEPDYNAVKEALRAIK